MKISKIMTIMVFISVILVVFYSKASINDADKPKDYCINKLTH